MESLSGVIWFDWSFGKFKGWKELESSKIRKSFSRTLDSKIVLKIEALGSPQFSNHVASKAPSKIILCPSPFHSLSPL
jgi:hypothetical protein